MVAWDNLAEGSCYGMWLTEVDHMNFEHLLGSLVVDLEDIETVGDKHPLEEGIGQDTDLVDSFVGEMVAEDSPVVEVQAVAYSFAAVADVDDGCNCSCVVDLD